MAFQRSYSKVWWGSDNQLQPMTSAGSSFTSGGFYSYLNQQQHQQHHQQKQQQQFSGSSSGYHSLDYNNFKSYSGNLSRIQEVDDEHNISKLSWEKRDSPGSLRSQDSGFSDNDESQSTRSRNSNATVGTHSPSAKSESISAAAQIFDSPTSMTEERLATPPTVVRRVGKSEFYSPLVNVSRRISFSGSPASAQTMSRDKQQQQEDVSLMMEGSTLLAQLDSMKLEDAEEEEYAEAEAAEEEVEHKTVKDAKDSSMSAKPKQLNFDSVSPEPSLSVTPCQCSKQRRRRRIVRKPTKPLSPTYRRTATPDDDDVSSDEAVTDFRSYSPIELDAANIQPEAKSISAYNNETVYLGEAPPPYNNETVILGGVPDESSNSYLKYEMMSPAKDQHYTASTSTPKAYDKSTNFCNVTFTAHCPEQSHPLLNGHAPSLQSWLGDMRMSYEHEVMSTLQTKSIAAEAFKNLTITTNTVAKLIRQLQQRAICTQAMFERMERILNGDQTASLAEAFSGAEELIADVAELSNVLERRAVFFTESRADRRRYEQNIEQMKLITKDTRISLEKQHYINLESLLEDLQVLKRYLLISLRLVFEKLVRVIVQSIEQSRCDLMLRANINMIATLTNIDYEGFASLTHAFIQNEAVRALLVICLEHSVSSVRALALRALATICCAPEAIMQLGACGGIEILRDILQVVDGAKSGESELTGAVSDMERREAVSLLTQITAAWHGPDHRVDGLRDCAETIIEGLTALMTRTTCAQTLLLCAAALNNLSRIEVTSHYSIMSNEAIFMWIETVQQRENGISIFVYEQIATMLYNMSLNKKCHSHLANGSIINFITSIYQMEFYRIYETRSQRDAQRRTIKAILHTLTRLVNESSLGPELLELQGMPVFLQTALAAVDGDQATQQQHYFLQQQQQQQQQQSLDGIHGRDISLLAHQLLSAQQPESIDVNGATVQEAGEKNAGTSVGLKFKLTRQESYV